MTLMHVEFELNVITVLLLLIWVKLPDFDLTLSFEVLLIREQLLVFLLLSTAHDTTILKVSNQLLYGLLLPTAGASSHHWRSHIRPLIAQSTVNVDDLIWLEKLLFGILEVDRKVVLELLVILQVSGKDVSQLDLVQINAIKVLVYQKLFGELGESLRPPFEVLQVKDTLASVWQLELVKELLLQIGQTLNRFEVRNTDVRPSEHQNVGELLAL